MAISQTTTDAFQAYVLTGTYKLALYTSSATLNSSTTVYTTTDEVSGGGYTAGGVALTVSVGPTTTDGTPYISVDDAVWSPASFTSRGGLIYNTAAANQAVAVLDFGADKTATNTFTVQFPAATSTTAILRVVRG